ncbi:unknown protein [Seminavis robusta]|uniref:Uncharacterized protein n=1 Tax=Seminavis robusta TaxID=568900 RepID=A0A9N8DIU1_9STRA|nr:unknown protein [Seminavis robusta]|eukprot:Sro167_g074440.1 n/a (257) ;mRNA; r:39793-40563
MKPAIDIAKTALTWFLLGVDLLVLLLLALIKKLNDGSGLFLARVSYRRHKWLSVRYGNGSATKFLSRLGRKKVTIQSPPPKAPPRAMSNDRDAQLPPMNPREGWHDAPDIDGVSGAGCLDEVAVFYKKQGYEKDIRLQGVVTVERFGNHQLHRVKIEGNESVKDNGQSSQGDKAVNCIYLPAGTHIGRLNLMGKTCRSSNKIFGKKYCFAENDEGLEHIQLLIKMGTRAELLSNCLHFQDVFELALCASSIVDMDD